MKSGLPKEIIRTIYMSSSATSENENGNTDVGTKQPYTPTYNSSSQSNDWVNVDAILPVGSTLSNYEKRKTQYLKNHGLHIVDPLPITSKSENTSRTANTNVQLTQIQDQLTEQSALDANVESPDATSQTVASTESFMMLENTFNNTFNNGSIYNTSESLTILKYELNTLALVMVGLQLYWICRVSLSENSTNSTRILLLILIFELYVMYENIQVKTHGMLATNAVLLSGFLLASYIASV
tara:strand:- start:1173 stop:1892 length:720 start_codon:yes stop_codon:yes gene_type:complete